MNTQTFPGNRYDITIESDTTDGYFEISAVNRNSGRKSVVTNMNAVISEILDPVLEIEDEDIETSIFISDYKKHEQLVEWAKHCLRDKHWINNYLETSFDEDMELGGWNSGEADE